MISLSFSPQGVSKAILDAAGQAVELECQNLGKETLIPRVDIKHNIATIYLGNDMDKKSIIKPIL